MYTANFATWLHIFLFNFVAKLVTKQKTMKKKVIRIILTSVLLLIAWLIDRNYNLPMWQTLIVYFVPYLLISYDVLGEAVEGLRRKDFLP